MRKRRCAISSEVGERCLEDRGRYHELRNASGLWKLEKVRK